MKNKMDNKIKVIVTGGAGFIGSNLSRELIDRGFNVHIIDNLSTGNKNKIPAGAIFHKANITDLKKIKPIFREARFVFHLAALPRVQLSIDDPITTNNINVTGTLNVLMAAQEAQVEKLIYSASSSAYGNQTKLPLKENFSAMPLSPYGLQKHIGEHYCRIFSSVYGLKTVALRYFNVYGPGMSDKGSYLAVFAVFLNQKNKGQPLTIVGDGKQTRSFTNVKDVVRANILAMQSNKVGQGEVINICSEKAYSVNEIAKIIGGPIIYLPERGGEIKYSQGDTSLAKKLLRWESRITLEEGIAELKKIYLS